MKVRGLRARLWLTVALGSAFVIGGAAVGFNLLLRDSLNSAADRVVRERADASLETVAVSRDGVVRLVEAPSAQDAGTGIWVFYGDRELERPPGSPPIQELAKALDGSSDRYQEEAGSDTLLYARAIRDGSGEQVGTIVASLSLDPYEDTERQALIASVGFSLLIWLAIVLVSRYVLERALRPVARMTREATEWSEHDLDHRFAAGEPYDEITELAAAFDSMLDRLASSLRHEQRLSAEISHELRTPLAAMLAEVEVELKRGRGTTEQRVVLERIAERGRALTEILETLLAAARADGPSRPVATPVVPAVERAGELAAAGERGREVDFSVLPADEKVTVDVDGQLLERILGPVVENAFRFARSSVSASITEEDAFVRVAIADDGPGLEAGESEEIFEPGVRGSAGRAGTDEGAGLGLALSRRLARAAGGELSAVEGEGTAGALFVVSVPAAPSAPLFS